MPDSTYAYRVPGSHNVSAFNADPEVRDHLDFPEPLRLIDSTLRKSLFTAGATTTTAGFLRMASALGELGVRDESVNVNWAGSTNPSPQELALVRAIASRDFGFALNVYADTLIGNGRDPKPVTTRQTVDVLVEAGVGILGPGIVEAPDDDAQLRQKDELAAYFEYARSVGVTTTITLAQVGLRDFGRLVEMSRYAVSLGATRLDLMDSTSSLSVDAMTVFVRRFRDLVGREVPITMHMHDEFGLATAGAVAAATVGASPDVSMNGVSYRSGFAPLEEVVLALETLYGVDTGIELNRIESVSRLVARETGIPVPPLKPLTGGYAFLKHMPGDAAAAIPGDQSVFPPVSHGLVPSRMGQEMTWVWGGLSSDGMTRALGHRAGEELSPAEVSAVRRVLDAEVGAIDRYPRWLAPDDAIASLTEAVAILRAGIGADERADIIRTALPSAPLADRAVTATLPLDAAAVPRAVGDLLLGTTDDDLLALLAGFQRLGSTAGEPSTRAALSAAEERGIDAASAALAEAIRLLADDYEARFGFRFVVAADGLGSEEILQELATRLGSDRDREIATTRRAAATIVTGRIRRMLVARSRDNSRAAQR
ncbi:hypothetical protein GCM10025867_35820 [Frondihabitans sucicola]|uniref:Pyruvate carboxyltransferase domain-containing protein n=1 Tax=Frondihabitans sucicola TaxID=1268041 RepID=A0ABM8GS85_9MICO|nr:2-oxo-4-hydroxy-4-carboxy-5-ureidoimidazoline decarboxylase [Frondihabitans sucicola]BDZ51341.1 hypothetical protein GCM10025867_35820 [Frondihabitans sucicola]